MWRGTETDIDLFFSGSVREDDGEWSGGQSLDNSDSGKNSGGTLCQTQWAYGLNRFFQVVHAQ